MALTRGQHAHTQTACTQTHSMHKHRQHAHRHTACTHRQTELGFRKTCYMQGWFVMGDKLGTACLECRDKNAKWIKISFALRPIAR